MNLNVNNSDVFNTVVKTVRVQVLIVQSIFMEFDIRTLKMIVTENCSKFNQLIKFQEYPNQSSFKFYLHFYLREFFQVKPQVSQ